MCQESAVPRQRAVLGPGGEGCQGCKSFGLIFFSILFFPHCSHSCITFKPKLSGESRVREMLSLTAYVQQELLLHLGLVLPALGFIGGRAALQG